MVLSYLSAGQDGDSQGAMPAVLWVRVNQQASGQMTRSPKQNRRVRRESVRGKPVPGAHGPMTAERIPHASSMVDRDLKTPPILLTVVEAVRREWWTLHQVSHEMRVGLRRLQDESARAGFPRVRGYLVDVKGGRQPVYKSDELRRYIREMPAPADPSPPARRPQRSQVSVRRALAASRPAVPVSPPPTVVVERPKIPKPQIKLYLTAEQKRHMFLLDRSIPMMPESVLREIFADPDTLLRPHQLPCTQDARELVRYFIRRHNPKISE